MEFPGVCSRATEPAPGRRVRGVHPFGWCRGVPSTWATSIHCRRVGSTAQDAYNAAEMLRGALRSIVNQEILVSIGKPVLVYGVDPVGVWCGCQTLTIRFRDSG